MRFFTDDFFSEEQKAELLGNKYPQMKRKAHEADEGARCRACEITQMRESLARKEEEFVRESQFVELMMLPAILFAMLAFGFVSSFVLDSMV